jgi:ATP-dependent exoDNAse (exonuclease V) beta subunit
MDWWELTGKEKTISLTEGQNAMTILTIHKSKGLEFNTVFVPFCDWEIVPSSTKAPYLWVHPDREPFNLFDLVLVKYGSHLEKSIFAEAYFKEMLSSMVDNLNLLYVAFTRAVNNLIITCPYNSKNNSAVKCVGNIIQRILENPALMDSIEKQKYSDISSFWNPDTRLLEFGKISFQEIKKRTKNILLKEFRIKGNEDRLKLRIHSEGYFDLYRNELGERINFGRMLHEIFENISTSDDISKSVKNMVSAGKIDSETAKEYEVMIKRMLAAEPVRSWFGGEWKILNERNILRGKEGSHRPDRIMIKDGKIVLIDYKTGEKHENHLSQVRGYLNDFGRMGFNERKGYLWYLNSNELVEV